MLQFALIGCGRISWRHAEQISRIGKLVAVCDIDAEKAAKLAAAYNTPFYTSIEDLLKAEPNIDMVSVCTPNGFHAEHAIKSLQAGKHVLCEKPMCLTTAAAWQIIETEKFSRKKLFVVKSARFNPLLQQLKNLVQQETLGKIYSFQLSCFWNRPQEYYSDWHGKKFPDGGTLYTQFSHYIDALLWILGPLFEAKGYCSNAAHPGVMEFEDTGVASLMLHNNVLGTLNWSVNTYQKNSEIALTIIAEKGTVCLGGEYLNKVVYQQLPSGISLQEPAVTPNNYDTYKGTMSHHKEVYDHLLAAMNNTSNTFTNAFDGLHTVEAIEKIYTAVGSPLFLPA